jgi:hypothetical protein
MLRDRSEGAEQEAYSLALTPLANGTLKKKEGAQIAKKNGPDAAGNRDHPS